MSSMPQVTRTHNRVSIRSHLIVLIGWIWWSGVTLSACYEVELSSPSKQPTPIKSDDAHEVNIRFTLDQGAEWIALRGLALGVSIREQDSGLKVRDHWLDYLVEEPTPTSTQRAANAESSEGSGLARISIKSLAPLSLLTGSYTLSFYFKRDALNLSAHEGPPAEASCPTPISLRSPLSAPQLDPGFGVWSGSISSDVTLSIELSAQSCGPGSIRSELVGSIDLPLTLSDAERSSLMIHLTPLDRLDDESPSNVRSPLITFPLSSHLSPVVEVVYGSRSSGEDADNQEGMNGEEGGEESDEESDEESGDAGAEVSGDSGGDSGDSGDELEGGSEANSEANPEGGTGQDDNENIVDQIPIAERFTFSINQLPEGRFSAQVFVDSDGDALPTPCDRARGSGGDEWVGVTSPSGSNLTITRGQRLTLDDVWTLNQVEACRGLRVALDTISLDTDLDASLDTADEALDRPSDDPLSQPVIFLGQVALTPEVLSALALTPQRRVWLSTRRRAITPYRFVDASPLFTLEQAMISQGRFSVHLPRSAIYEPEELAIWIDDDGDRALTPCDDPTQLGADLWWWDGDTETLSTLLDLEPDGDLPRTPIIISQRCAPPSSMLELTFEFDFGWPSDVSTRPLVVLIDDLISGELLQFTITDLNEQTLDSVAATRLRLPEGSYAVSAYIDQDLNQRFTPCDVDELGDRFHTTGALTTRLSLGEIQRLNLLIEEQRDCSFSSDLAVSLSSNITNAPLNASEVEALNVSPEVVTLDHGCAPNQVWIELSDLDKLHHPPQAGVISTQCATFESSLESPPERSEGEPLEIIFDSIPPSAVELRACALMSEQGRELSVERASRGVIANTWSDCRVPLYWSAREELAVTQPDVQRINLWLTPRCVCD